MIDNAIEANAEDITRNTVSIESIKTDVEDAAGLANSLSTTVKELSNTVAAIQGTVNANGGTIASNANAIQSNINSINANTGIQKFL